MANIFLNAVHPKKVVNALKELNDHFELSIVLGGGYEYEEKLYKILQNLLFKYKIYKNVKNIADIMASRDIAIVSFGTIGYELSCIGVPSIFLCISKDHEEHATIFQQNGFAINLGLFHHVSKEIILKKVLNLFNNKELKNHMHSKASNIIDGKGAKRIVDIILQRC